MSILSGTKTHKMNIQQKIKSLPELSQLFNIGEMLDMENTILKKVQQEQEKAIFKLLKEGLQLKGFEFSNDDDELKVFMKSNCKAETHPTVNKYFVNDDLFFVHLHEFATFEVSADPMKAVYGFGKYYFV